MPDTFRIQPDERYWYCFDFTAGCTNVTDPGNPDTMLSYTITARDADGTDVTVTLLGRTDKDGPGPGPARIDTWHFRTGYYVFFLAYGGGVDDQTYTWECIGETSSGQTIDLDATMKVKET